MGSSSAICNFLQKFLQEFESGQGDETVREVLRYMNDLERIIDLERVTKLYGDRGQASWDKMPKLANKNLTAPLTNLEKFGSHHQMALSSL